MTQWKKLLKVIISNILLDIDLYPTSITLSIDGKNQHKTALGGCISILIKIIVLIIALIVLAPTPPTS